MKCLLPLPWFQHGCSINLGLNQNPVSYFRAMSSRSYEEVQDEILLKQRLNWHSWKAFPAFTDTCSEQIWALRFWGEHSQRRFRYSFQEVRRGNEHRTESRRSAFSATPSGTSSPSAHLDLFLNWQILTSTCRDIPTLGYAFQKVSLY